MEYLYDACDQILDFCHQQLLRKMRRKISWTDRGKTVYTPPPLGSGIITKIYNIFIHSAYKSVKLEAQWAEPVLLTFHSALRKLNQCSS
jgi:hypothetical protein